MSNKRLKTITFPGLDDVYTIPDEAPEYSASATYKVGDFVVYGGALYKCNTAIESAEDWTAAHWTVTKMGNEVSGLQTAITQTNELIGLEESKSGTSGNPTAYGDNVLLSGLTFKKDAVYDITYHANSGSGACYFYCKDEQGTSLRSTSFTFGDSTEYKDVFIPTANNSNSKITFKSGVTGINITATFSERTSGDKINTALDNTNTIVANGGVTIDAVFANGGLTAGQWTSNLNRICTPAENTASYDMNLFIADGYRVGVQTLANGSWNDSGWVKSQYFIPKDTVFKIVIAQDPDYSGTADIETFKSAVIVKTKTENSIATIENVPVVANPFRFKRYFSHIGVSQTSNIVIPYLSLWDVARAKRLGFDVLEINVLKTSDSKYICVHGNDGKFGTQYEGVNGEDVSNTTVSSMTLQGIKDTIRFKTKYAKYKSAPCSLEELLQECKRQNIIPLCQYVDSGSIEILNKIMGRNNYILSIYAFDRDGKTTAPITSWLNITDKDELLAKCKKSGGIYIAGLNVSDSAYDSFTDSDWTSLIDAVHKEGYFVSFNSVYSGEAKAQKLFDLGFDNCGSGWNINEIENGNLCNLFGETEFSDFTTNGTTANNVLTLSDEQTVTPNATLPSVFLGGGSLHIRFSGTITLQFGVGINTQFTSDGESEMWFSTYFEEASPTFTITASGSVSIYEITYKASKM